MYEIPDESDPCFEAKIHLLNLQRDIDICHTLLDRFGIPKESHVGTPYTVQYRIKQLRKLVPGPVRNLTPLDTLEGMTYGGLEGGSHWAECHRVHWDCRIRVLEERVSSLEAELDRNDRELRHYILYDDEGKWVSQETLNALLDENKRLRELTNRIEKEKHHE